MTTINNPVAQIAQMYNLIEAALRKEELSAADLSNKPEIKALAKSAWQARDIVKTLVKKGHVTKEGEGKDATYKWNLGSKPFVLPAATRKQAMRAPSSPNVVSNATSAPVPAKPLPASVTPKEIEVVLDGTLIIIGRNPQNNRIRITIEAL